MTPSPAFISRLFGGAGPVPAKPLYPRSPAVPGPVDYHPDVRCVCGCLAVEHDNGGWCRSGEPCGCSYVQLAPMVPAGASVGRSGGGGEHHGAALSVAVEGTASHARPTNTAAEAVA